MSDHEKEHSAGEQADGKHAAKSHGHGGGHHGGGHEEGHEGAPEWLISFADNVTLMMGFFVILLAMNMNKAAGAAGGAQDGNQAAAAVNQPTPAMLDLAIAIREGFNNPVNPNSTNPGDWPLIQRVRERAKEGFALDSGIKGNTYEVQSIRTTNYRKPAGSVSFDDNSSALSDAARESAAAIARHFHGVRTILEIRGHSSAAEAFGDSSRAMALSFERAMAVAKVLAEHGIDWRQIRIVACKDNDRVRPLAYDKNDQRQNERVEVFPTDMVMPVYVSDEEPTPADMK